MDVAGDVFDVLHVRPEGMMSELGASGNPPEPLGPRTKAETSNVSQFTQIFE